MSESVRSLERGLCLLSALERLGSAGLSDLARASDLPLATTSRLLASLVAAGWAERRLNDGRYLPTLPGRQAAPAVALRSLGAKLGARHLPGLSERVGLPVDLALAVSLGVMEVIDSTRKKTSGGVDPKVAGFRPSLVFSSPGRAFLATNEAQRQRHLTHVLQGDTPAERFAVTSGSLERELLLTRQRGYAERAAGYWPDSSDYGAEPMDIAVALTTQQGALGSLSLVWPARQMRPKQVAEQHLSALRDAAAALSRALERELPWSALPF